MKIGMNTDFSSLTKIPLVFWIILAMILFTQAVWLFMDASKRNANKWLWGILGLFQAPTPFILYFLIVRKIFSRDNKEKRIIKILITLYIIIIVIFIIVSMIFHD